MKNSLLKQKGIVLVMTLIFLQLLSILMIYGLQNHVMVTKLNQDMQHRLNLLLFAKSHLVEIENNLQRSTPLCQIPILSPNILALKSLEWWQSVGCYENFRDLHFYYVIEFLGDDPCAIVDTKLLYANYYRISLLLTENVSRQRILIQSTIIKPTNLSETCKFNLHSLQIGRQSFIQLQ